MFDDLFDITILEIATAHIKKCPKPFQRMNKKRHAYGLFYVAAGGATFFYKKTEFTVVQNSMILLDKESDYHYHCIGEENLVFYIIDFHMEKNNQMPVDGYMGEHKFLGPQFERICDIWAKKQLGFKLQSKSVLYQILCELTRIFAGSVAKGKNFQKVFPAVEYMNQFYHSEITVDKLAQLCNMSETHFRRIFGEVYNIPPKRFLSALKIERAKELLKTGLYNVSETAELTGFQNVYHFSHCFKRITGVSPSKY